MLVTASKNSALPAKAKVTVSFNYGSKAIIMNTFIMNALLGRAKIV